MQKDEARHQRRNPGSGWHGVAYGRGEARSFSCPRVWVVEFREHHRAKWRPTQTRSLRPAVYLDLKHAQRDVYNGECGYYPPGMLRIIPYTRSRRRG